MAMTQAERARRYRQRIRRRLEETEAAGADHLGPVDQPETPLEEMTDDERLEEGRRREAVVQPAVDWRAEPTQELERRMIQTGRRVHAEHEHRNHEAATLLQRQMKAKHATLRQLAHDLRAPVEVLQVFMDTAEWPTIGEWPRSRQERAHHQIFSQVGDDT